MAPSQLLVFGDSVTWGQGLRAEHKFSTLVQQARAAAGERLSVTMLAHSGATIGVRGPTNPVAIDGEVPVSSPTIMNQVAGYAGDVRDVAVILLNGGINDIDIRTILSPLTSHEDLAHDVQKYCFIDMLTLLTTVTRRFPSPTLRCVVPAYYPLLSHDSELLRIPSLLQRHGVTLLPFVDDNVVFEKIISLCTQFWQQSTAQLQRAVDACNAADGAGRVALAIAPFSERNVTFASDPWLFGLNEDLSPQDEVAAPRHAACDASIDLIDLIRRETCYRASVGHPNPQGAEEYAKAIASVI